MQNKVPGSRLIAPPELILSDRLEKFTSDT